MFKCCGMSIMTSIMLKFPKSFLWGASSAAHQVEGNNHNDWTEWEAANAERLAAEADGLFGSWIPNWDRFKTQATDPENYISGEACDQFNRFESDFDLARELGMNAQRVSLEWSRLEPEEGRFDAAAVQHYREVIQALKARGMEPFITIWHWTLPLWVRDQGGWRSTKTVRDFGRLAETMTRELGSEVRFWITLNEPEMYAEEAYLTGNHPPGARSTLAYLQVTRNLIRGHRLAYAKMKRIRPGAQIGIAKDNAYLEPYQNKLLNRWFTRLVDWWWNYSFLNRIKNWQDFIGLNYYFHHRLHLGREEIGSLFGGQFKSWNENKVVSDIGVELYPEGIYDVLQGLKRYRKPIYITEHGLADERDAHRSWYVAESLRQVHRAMTDGADVRGYMHWSLLDNFEWAKGFWPRFGLIKVNFETQGRTIRDSAWEYAAIIKSGGVEE